MDLKWLCTFNCWYSFDSFTESSNLDRKLSADRNSKHIPSPYSMMLFWHSSCSGLYRSRLQKETAAELWPHIAFSVPLRFRTSSLGNLWYIQSSRALSRWDADYEAVYSCCDAVNSCRQSSLSVILVRESSRRAALIKQAADQQEWRRGSMWCVSNVWFVEIQLYLAWSKIHMRARQCFVFSFFGK